MYRKVSTDCARALLLRTFILCRQVRGEASLALPPARANLIPDASDRRQRICCLHINP